MSDRRVLVDCALLSLQDSCVFYPCCKSCFSKIEADRGEAARFRCPKCGYWCLKAEVDYRYRLSLRVTRNNSIFGVTVFGNCLTPFFGIQASGLQRLVECSDGSVGPSVRASLLVKAVEDCFIGRHFIFGMKLSGTEREPWLGGPTSDGSGTRQTAQFTASQMILPLPTGLSGCTVLSCYQILLQKASESEVRSTEPTKTSRPPLHDASQSSSSIDATLSASDHFTLPLLRFNTLSPKPLWQSLGMVTSSAEQEESCSFQDSKDESNTLFQYNEQKTTEERTHFLPSPHSNPSVFAFFNSPYSKGAGGTYPSLSQPSHTSHSLASMELLSGLLAWEDLPLSESLTEFLGEKNKACDDLAAKRSHFQSNKTPNLGTEPVSALCSDLDLTNQAEDGCINPPEWDQECEEDRYNCSDDLFSDSLMISGNTETVQLAADSFQSFQKDDLQLKTDCFIPPSQSTPIVKGGTGSHSASSRQESSKENSPWCSNKLRHADRRRSLHHFEQQVRQLRRASNQDRTALNHKHFPELGEVMLLGHKEEDDGVVAPTPPVKPRRFVFLKRPHGSSGTNGPPEATRKRLPLDQSWTLSLTERSNVETVDEGTADGSAHRLSDKENLVCDWSRDLFSDSV